MDDGCVLSDDPRVLILGADAEARSALAGLLDAQGFRTEVVASAAAAEERLAAWEADLIILDGQLGDGGAIAVCRRLAVANTIPIIVISDTSDVTERVIALEVGADDLMARPVNTRELLARARALVRRTRALRNSAPDAGAADRNWNLNPVSRTLAGPGGERVSLTPQETALMHVFLSNPGRPISAEFAAERMGPVPFSATNFRTSIVRLRRKLGRAGFGPFTIRTLRSGGYFIEPQTAQVTRPLSRAAAPAADGLGNAYARSVAGA